VECKSKSDTINNRRNCKHLKIIQTIPVPHDEKAQNKGNAENSRDEHRMPTSASTDVKVQNIPNMQNNITCSTNCKFRLAATLYTLET